MATGVFRVKVGTTATGINQEIGYLASNAMKYYPMEQVMQFWIAMDSPSDIYYFAVNPDGRIYLWNNTTIPANTQLSAPFTWVY